MINMYIMYISGGANLLKIKNSCTSLFNLRIAHDKIHVLFPKCPGNNIFIEHIP